MTGCTCLELENEKDEPGDFKETNLYIKWRRADLGDDAQSSVAGHATHHRVCTYPIAKQLTFLLSLQGGFSLVIDAWHNLTDVGILTSDTKLPQPSGSFERKTILYFYYYFLFFYFYLFIFNLFIFIYLFY